MVDATDAESTELVNLCDRIKEGIQQNAFKACMEDICYAMYLHPDSPEPHNLMGILMEKQRNHLGAMKHFRAALDLDPTYLPARENMMDYARFDIPAPRCRYCYADCRTQEA